MSVIKELKETKDALVALEGEKVKIDQIAEEHKAQLVGLTEKLEQANKEIADMKASAEASAKAMADLAEAHKAEVEKLKAEIADGKAKLALMPPEAKVEGIAPVADGGEAKEDKPVNHIEEMNKLSGAAKIAYYREHQAEIDKNYRR